MKLYLIGGLGANERVFQFLDIDNPTQIINWIEPKNKESIEEYTERLIVQIDIKEKFGLLGVSFGGIIAVELTKQIKPQITIFISSVELTSQLPQKYIWLGKVGILNFIPNRFLKPPEFAMNFMFGAKNKELLKQIIRDTKPTFIKWALDTLVNWKNDKSIQNVVRIHGTRDMLIPLIGKAIEIENGKHFMIVDNSIEISNLVNRTMENAE